MGQVDQLDSSDNAPRQTVSPTTTATTAAGLHNTSNGQLFDTTPTATTIEPSQSQCQLSTTTTVVDEEAKVTTDTGADVDADAENNEQQHFIPCSLPAWYQLLKRCIFLLAIGALAVSYWRGLWTLVDIYTCNQPEDASLFDGDSFCLAFSDAQNPRRRNNALVSYSVGLFLLSIGKILFYFGFFPLEEVAFLTSTRERIQLAATRILMVQLMGTGYVLSWRGIWMLVEYWFYPNDFFKSAWLSTILGLVGCALLQCTASLVAAPAAILEDPAVATFGTIGSIVHGRSRSSNNDVVPSRQEQEQPQQPDSLRLISTIADFLVSYVALTILAVSFWRGVWALQDYHLWGFTASMNDLQRSLGMSFVIFVCCMIASQLLHDCMHRVRLSFSHPSAVLLLSRTQNILMGVASVSFWRVTWYAWEMFGGGATPASAWVACSIGVAGSNALGAFASVTFPPSVDEFDATEVSLNSDGQSSGSTKIRWFAIAR